MGVSHIKRAYPAADVVKTGKNLKRIMQTRGLSVKDLVNKK